MLLTVKPNKLNKQFIGIKHIIGYIIAHNTNNTKTILFNYIILLFIVSILPVSNSNDDNNIYNNAEIIINSDKNDNHYNTGSQSLSDKPRDGILFRFQNYLDFGIKFFLA